MSSWRVLELSEQPHGAQIPQLLVKSVFRRDSYTVHLTCLSNIWSEELDLAGIVERAAKEQSPIEVSKQDTAQLAILLHNVKKSLERSNDAICRLTRTEGDGITLHVTVALPEPLDSLNWKFHLEKRPSTDLKNELILPLLLSSHIQHVRVARLVAAISDKDKVITRLVDQYESSNLDLAAAFPVISGLKVGKKIIKREQAARHVPALQPFREDAFKQETVQQLDMDVGTLGLFREALSECESAVPSQFKSDVADLKWWTGIPERVSRIKAPAKGKASKCPSAPGPTRTDVDCSGDETEDEFETHPNFKTRSLPLEALKTAVLSPPPDRDTTTTTSDDEVTEDDDDLDALPRRPSEISSNAATKIQQSRLESSTPEMPIPLLSKASPGAEPKDADATPDVHELPVQEPPSSNVSPKKVKSAFKIGGRGRGGVGSSSQVIDNCAPLMADRTRAAQSPSAQPVRETTPIVEAEREETAEEKAERRRAELKRKTEEAAKKLAQSKKKRRF